MFIAQWLSINKSGESRELISARECMFTYPGHDPWQEQTKRRDSRFEGVPCFSINSDFEIQVRTRFLSPHVVYTINLVYKFDSGNQLERHALLRKESSKSGQREHVPLKYKLDEETTYSKSCVAQREHAGWLSTELYQFTSCQKEHDFKIQFFSQSHRPQLKDGLVLEGVEFRPVKFEKDEKLEDENMVDIQTNNEVEIDWEQKLPSDWPEIIRWSKEGRLQWNTKKELYYLLRKGFFIERSCKQWFSISKNGKKRLMLPASAVLLKEPILMSLCGRKTWILKSDPNSRFGTVAEASKIKSFAIDYTSEFNVLSDKTTYACYLVYKLPKEHSSVFEGIVQLGHSSWGQLIYLLTPPHTPIVRSDVNQEPLKTRKIKGHPKLRKDGWMEIQISDFLRNTVSISYRLSSYDKWNFTGLLVQGVEFRPAKVTFS